MTLLFVFFGCLFTLFALWRAVAPFLGGADEGIRLEHLAEEVREIELLVSRHQVLLVALRELDFDRETAKIGIDDYEKFRNRYEADAVALMRRLDEIHGGRDWQIRVNEELEQRLGHPPLLGTSAEQSDSEITPEEIAPEDGTPDAEHTTQSTDTNGEPELTLDHVEPEPIDGRAIDCVGCGEQLESDDKFCSQCGAPVGVSEPPDTEFAKSEASA